MEYRERLLKTYPGEVAHLDCSVCDRAGRYPKAALVERFGPDTGLVGVLNTLVGECRMKRNPATDSCGAHWRELAEEWARRPKG
jgi:hypothetical protein